MTDTATTPTPDGSAKGNIRCVLVYPAFNRIWHWSQAGSIFLLMFTGARLMRMHQILSFETAVTVHTLTALALLLLWLFATFWLFTTEAWKQFIPKTEGLFRVMRFYAWGVFHGEEHPYRKSYKRRHNPLQALAYLAVKIALFPAIWVSGLIYLGYGLWDDLDNASFLLQIVANIHILSAFSIAAFVVVHTYLLTIGHGFLHHIRPMIFGFEKVELTAEEEAYFMADMPERLRTPRH